jgi:hypothetical protein
MTFHVKGSLKLTFNDDGSLKLDAHELKGDECALIKELKSLASYLGAELIIEKHIHSHNDHTHDVKHTHH